MASLLRLESAAAMSYGVRSNLTFTRTCRTIIEQGALNVLIVVSLKSLQRAVNRLGVYCDLRNIIIPMSQRGFYLRVSEFIQRIPGPCKPPTDLAKSASPSPGRQYSIQLFKQLITSSILVVVDS